MDLLNPSVRGRVVFDVMIVEEQCYCLACEEEQNKRVKNELENCLDLNVVQEVADVPVKYMAESQIGHDAPHVSLKNLIVGMHSIVDSARSNH